MKIVIVDDETLARQRLRSLIEAIGGHEIVGEAATGEEAVQVCARRKPELVLLDIRMPGGDGLQAATRINDMAEPPARVFVTACGDDALAAFEADAVDYLRQPARQERVPEAAHYARRMHPA